MWILSELFKQIGEAWNERLRSPFLGSIFLFFLAANWRPIFYLLFAEKPVRARFLFFDANTSHVSLYLIPIGGGVTFALASPWLKLLGAWVASFPKARLHSLEETEAQKRRIAKYQLAAREEEAKAALEAAEEDRKIDAAKRLEEAKNVQGSELEEELKRDREERETARNPVRDQLSKLEQLIVLALGIQGDGNVDIQELISSPDFSEHAEKVVPNITLQRLRIDSLTAMKRLQEMDLVDKDPFGKWTLSSKGYSLFDQLDARRKS